MLGDRFSHGIAAVDHQLDPVGNVETGLLASFLDDSNQLSRHAFANQVLVQTRIQSRQVTLLFGAGETFG